MHHWLRGMDAPDMNCLLLDLLTQTHAHHCKIVVNITVKTSWIQGLQEFKIHGNKLIMSISCNSKAIDIFVNIMQKTLISQVTSEPFQQIVLIEKYYTAIR